MIEPDLLHEPGTNAELLGYLTRLGWTPEQFAYHLNWLATSLRLSAEIHPKTPRKWLKAQQLTAQPVSRASPGLGWCARCYRAISRSQ